YPTPPGFADASLSPAAARWDETLGEYILDWDDVRTAADPRGAALQFAQSAFHHACLVCGWDTELAASAASRPPPVRCPTPQPRPSGGPSASSSSWRRNHIPVSFRPSGARSSHGYIPHTASSPRS